MLKNLVGIAVIVMATASPSGAAEVTFEAPELILDASSYLYPSPVFEDIDGDGKRELLIGDLRGGVAVYEYKGDGQSHKWGEPVKLQAGGKDAKLPNW